MQNSRLQLFCCAGGVYPITVTAGNGIGLAAQLGVTITVDQPPHLESWGGQNFRARHRHTLTFQATGHPLPKLSERGRLPKGLRFTLGRHGRAEVTGKATHADVGKTFQIGITVSNGSPSATEYAVFRLKIIS